MGYLRLFWTNFYDSFNTTIIRLMPFYVWCCLMLLVYVVFYK
jgi:hypothetical protein